MSLIALGFNPAITPTIRDAVFRSVASADEAKKKVAFGTETFYHTNDWGNSPNAEEFRSEIATRTSSLGNAGAGRGGPDMGDRGTGSPDLLKRVDGRVGSRIQAVYDSFAQRGLGNATKEGAGG
jgi:hypothetical protein